MGEIIALRLPQKTLARRNISLASDSATVYAILPMTDYYVAAGENAKFDANNSFSVGSEIVSYEWNLGEGWITGSSSLEYSFSKNSEIQVRVTDATGASAIARANVWIGEPTNNVLPAPDVAVVKDKANISYLSINTVPDGAQYILVRLNGFDLGYAEVGDRVRIGELKYSDDELLSFAYMDEEYNIGESSSMPSSEIGVDETIGFDMGDFEKPNGDTDPGYNVGPLATGIILSDGDCLVIAGVAILVLLLFLMHKKDARRSGKRPREGP